jgi:hypothetical protein
MLEYRELRRRRQSAFLMTRDDLENKMQEAER